MGLSEVSQSTGEIRPLTAIRGVAAIWVLGFHIPTSFPGAPHFGRAIFQYGFTAVDLFFVLSGFILATAHSNLTFRTSADFFWKRIFRLYPLHVSVMLALCAGLLLCRLVHLDVNGDGHYDWLGFPLSLLLLKPYFPYIPGDWNSATWSVGIELACYCTLPLCLPLLKGLHRRWLGFLILLISTVMTIWLSTIGDDFPHAGGGALMRGSLGFYLGCASGILMPRLWASLAPYYADAIVGSALLVGVAACCLGVPALIPVDSALLIAALSLDRGLAAACLTSRPLMWLGKVSFSIYLLHLPVFTFLFPIDR